MRDLIAIDCFDRVKKEVLRFAVFPDIWPVNFNVDEDMLVYENQCREGVRVLSEHQQKVCISSRGRSSRSRYMGNMSEYLTV